MRNRSHRANVFAHHAGDVARRVHGDGVKFADKIDGLGAYGDAGTALDTGVPADLKEDRFFFTHYIC